ncbi:copper-transporting P-type ATPase [Flavobacterium capsici]|uniref:Copper-translocating P-type ATPase n=1 Tax=Flavobacterium capsici TaxID=3075618 RepID=A0AA96F1E0_9FLAO|nr:MULTISPECIES: copper-translocating P-type ATPase [unclassified Flavobacterium]WNM18049.1 copper-translocating P-type ATPase [Flavobacterium sp. PMR2A8]WNM22101.1 copper-translocating P-type ATPase [Flavobacterium sp. PMTSA4]
MTHLPTKEEKHDCCSLPKEEHQHHKHHSEYKGGKYYCPMNCEGNKVYDQPGNCPVCGMELVQAVNYPDVTVKEYTCPMHPEIIKDAPGDCPICGMELVPVAPTDSIENTTYHHLLNKLKIALLFSIPVFIIAMSEMIPNNPLYEVMSIKVWNWVQFALTLPVVFYACWMFFERAYKSIITWNLNMFTLIGIGTGVAFLFSVFGMLFPDVFPAEFKSHHGTVHLYFEATVVVLTLVLIGQVLEAKAHSNTSSAIKELLKLAPTVATVIVDGKEKVISIDAIKKGDTIRVKPGEKIPVDGKIMEGTATIDESMISGEPIPVDKKKGSAVSAGTINGTTSFLMQAEKVGNETLLAQIVKMVSDASRSRAPIQNVVDKISKYFVPIVVIISAITFVIWSQFGPEPRLVYAFVNAVAVLIIACPCALGLATPMSIMVGVGKGAQSGVLIKNAEAIEKMNAIDVLLVDKTGTLTKGKPSVEKIIALQGSEVELLSKIASVNQNSEHPLATAVIKYAKSRNVILSKVKDFESVTGKGVLGYVDGEKISVGNKKLMEQEAVTGFSLVTNEIIAEQKQGKTVSYIAVNNRIMGYVTIVDAIKNSSFGAIKELQSQGIEVIMLTGDNDNTAKAVAQRMGLSNYKANCLPQDKLNYIKDLQRKKKKVAMAGDGINDAPALAQADVGIAMGTGSDVAIESAKITLVKGDLKGIVKAKNLSFAVMKNIKENLFFAFIYNSIGVPVAAGILYPFFGMLLSPMIAALAMSFSSVSVIFNALRLRTVEL